ATSLTLNAIRPGLTVGDIEKSLAWYQDVLGFAVKDRWINDDGVLFGAELGAGDMSVMLGQDDWQKGRERKKGEGVRLYFITTQDVDALAAQVQANGGTLAHEPADQAWGSRDFAIDDPDGYHLTITTVPTR
ncbi:MAG: VOC family protein, partial [Acidobacteria bacterium]|nr:VOC family protein [Acidobacteriota bacterium]